MSDVETEVKEVKPFAIDRAKSGRANCKKCKSSCEAKELRIARQSANNPFNKDVPMKNWYHVDCFFGLKTNKDSKLLETSDDIEGWELLSEEDKENIIEKIDLHSKSSSLSQKINYKTSSCRSDSKDNKFSTFWGVVIDISKHPSYKKKEEILNKFLRLGSNGKKFEGDLALWIKLLIPSVIRRIYNLGNKQIIKVFSRVFHIDHQRMITDLQSGDVAETVVKYFEKSKTIKPATSSTLTIKQIDNFLEDLSKFTQESQQQKHFEDFCKNCTIQDLKFIIRLIKHDLKMNCLGRHVLDSLHSQAYNSFQSSRDLNKVLIEFGDKIEDITKETRTTSKSTGLQVLVPISPMLAEACKDLNKAIKKCPGGFYSEIKYDGERVQIHKSQNDFKFYSRSLNDVVDHKVSRLKEYLPKAFPSSDDMILDSEILVVNTVTGAILPFGTLGIHKKNNFKDAEVCLFVFDVLYFNGKDLTKQPLKERRKLLEDNITVLKNHIHLSEYKLLKTTNALVDHVEEVLSGGLEGLVLKDVDGIYEPGKRHWLKVKKDYLCEGKIADTADLLILGAWYGTGKRGSLYSVYLMGSYDKKSNLWKTVTKCGNGLDDNTMHKMHTKLEKLVVDSNRKTPSWLKCSSSLIPDVIAKDPNMMPVLEIMANEFSESDVHTAVCSMRFPRIIKIRDDKTYKQATNMEELAHLFKESKAGTKLGALKGLKIKDTNNNADSKPSSKASSSGLTLITQFIKKETPETSSKTAVKRKSSFEKKDEKYEKKPKLSEIDRFDEKPPTSNGFFKGVHLYCSGTLLKDLKDDIIEFQKLGGELTKHSIDCTHALHSGRIFIGTMDELRTKYKNNCKHLDQRWLRSSIDSKAFADPWLFSVTLQQQ